MPKKEIITDIRIYYMYIYVTIITTLYCSHIIAPEYARIKHLKTVRILFRNGHYAHYAVKHRQVHARNVNWSN
jgi:hypothetical protein